MTRDRGWSLDRAALAGLRSAPLVGPDPRAWTDADGLVTIELAFLAQPAARRRVLLHQGDLGAAAAAPGSGWGWSFALQGEVAELQTWDTDAMEAWACGLGPDPWHRLALTLRFGPGAVAPRLVRGSLDGRSLERAPWRPHDDAIGELPRVDGLVLGGARDRAGGHTNLRFGERRGELVRSWTVSAGSAPTDPPSDAGAGVARAAPAVTVGDVHAEGLRYRAAPLEHEDEVWWDFEDEVAVGATVDRPAALVPAALSVHWLPRAAAPRELVAPLQSGATRPRAALRARRRRLRRLPDPRRRARRRRVAAGVRRGAARVDQRRLPHEGPRPAPQPRRRSHVGSAPTGGRRARGRRRPVAHEPEPGGRRPRPAPASC
jgi:hypothetical protein